MSATSWAPIVSVIVPHYQQEDTVFDTLESINKQTYDNVEAVVIDGSDSSKLYEYSKNSEWVNYRYQKPTGVSAARNLGISIAKGEVIGFCDADDYWHVEKLEKQLPLLEEGVDVVYSDQYILSRGEKKYRESMPIEDPDTHWIDYYQTGTNVPSRTVLVRKKCLQTHRFNTDLEAREDPHLWVRLFRDYTPGRVPEALAYKRTCGESLTSDIDLVYENERKSVRDLANRYPQLREFEKARLREARYRFVKRLFQNDRGNEARKHLLKLLIDDPTDYRYWVVLACSILPYTEKAIERLENVYNWYMKKAK